MEEFEKLGAFYLGEEYDLAKKSGTGNLLLYDSRDLVTHAVCVGMTGSGKTGLCISLLEEAAIDGIPAIVVDPKGDLGNLLLTFPELKPADFRPWINTDDARKKNLSPGEYAAEQADMWKQGLARWGQDGARIQRLRDAAHFSIFTPGSSAGRAVSIMKSFEAPPREIVQDPDLFRERIATTVTGLLSLIGVDADPIQSREHILLSTLLDLWWRQGRNADLATLIQGIQNPPLARIGFFDLESFFPSKERFSLAMKINNLVAAPGFQSWLEGEPLDIGAMLYGADGRPRVSIFSIAHLSDAERMFFVSLLLTQFLGWMRGQSGTTSLRALFYMDEIYGYLPPVANPPSKQPLLTMLKQGRAFGVGVVLATQNPVDLDYKGLSNTGTWFIGRLQTDRDKQRVLDGLEGAGASTGGHFDRRNMEEILAGLGKRVFLMNNVHEDKPVVFQSRWALSYLRGPLTREHIRTLNEEGPVGGVEEAQVSPPAAAPAAVHLPSGGTVSSKPVVPPEVPEFFVAARSRASRDGHLHYEPMVAGFGTLYYADAKAGVALEKPVSLLAEFSGGTSGIDWEQGQEVELSGDALEKYSEDDDAIYGSLPPAATRKNNYRDWEKALKMFLYRNRKLTLQKSPSSGLVSQPGESERDFRIRLQLAVRERRDGLVERVAQKYSARIAALEDRIRRAEQAVERERQQASQQKLSTAISFGATIFGALLGRKALSTSTLGRASTAATRAGRIAKESKDVARAQENVEELGRRLAELQRQLADEAEAARQRTDPLTEPLEEYELKLRKTDISVSFVGLVWVPFVQEEGGRMVAAW